MTDDAAESSLSWRVPSREEQAGRRKIVRQGLLSAVAFTIAALVTLSPEWWLAGLALGALLGGGVAGLSHLYQRWKYRDQLDNMLLCDDRFRWGTEQDPCGTFPRAQVQAFRIDRESNDAGLGGELVLVLQEAFESQPIPLFPPVTSATIRPWLADRWNLPELPSPRTAPASAKTWRLDVYLECHPEQATWHWEGTIDSLLELTTAIDQAADALPLPPKGAMPKTWEVVGTRRDGSELWLAVDHQAWLDDLTLAAPAEQWKDLANQLRTRLTTVADANKSANADFEFPFALGAKGNGTIVCHLLPSAAAE